MNKALFGEKHCLKSRHLSCIPEKSKVGLGGLHTLDYALTWLEAEVTVIQVQAEEVLNLVALEDFPTLSSFLGCELRGTLGMGGHAAHIPDFFVDALVRRVIFVVLKGRHVIRDSVPDVVGICFETAELYVHDEVLGLGLERDFSPT
jgi:hypothetical protein